MPKQESGRLGTAVALPAGISLVATVNNPIGVECASANTDEKTNISDTEKRGK